MAISTRFPHLKLLCPRGNHADSHPERSTEFIRHAVTDEALLDFDSGALLLELLLQS